MDELKKFHTQYQSGADLMQKLPFQYLVREICHDITNRDKEIRWQVSALLALQEAAEAMLVTEFTSIE
jgi:histone H3/H4